jgi:2'-5' RNA ligase
MNFDALPPRVRAFVAVRVAAEIEAALGELVRNIGAAHDAIRWTLRNNLHVTLRFLGAAMESRILPGLARDLAQIAQDTPAFVLRVRGIGAFPDLHRPRVIWAGLESDELAGLAQKIEAVAVARGLPPSDHPWTPHLTIGRVRNPRRIRDALAKLAEARERDFGTCRIGEIFLYRSTLTPEGSRYEKLASFTL